MELRKILQEDDILIPMQADSKEEAIRQLAEMLKAHEVVMDMDAFMSDVFLREAEGITGIGDYIAIPHGKSKKTELRLAYCRSLFTGRVLMSFR